MSHLLSGVFRPAEAEVLRPDRERLIHSPDGSAGRQGFGGAAPASDAGSDAARHGTVDKH